MGQRRKRRDQKLSCEFLWLTARFYPTHTLTQPGYSISKQCLQSKLRTFYVQPTVLSLPAQNSEDGQMPFQQNQAPEWKYTETVPSSDTKVK